MIPIILGPTGVGKSDFAIKLAKKINGEIISADSCQVYKYFDIGSAKVSKQQQKEIPHHLIDILNPDQTFNACLFQSYAKNCIDDIKSRGKVPIICGGTGLYIAGLVYNYDFNNAQRDENFRKECENIISEHGISVLYQRLVDCNPELARQINANDKTRIIRALETNSFPSKKNTNFNEYIIFAIDCDRAELYDNINKRVDIMVQNGLFEEVETILNKFGTSPQALKSIGYKEVVSYYKGELTKQKSIELIKQHSRNYAKRQLTFIRGLKNVIWIQKNKTDEVIENYEKYL